MSRCTVRAAHLRALPRARLLAVFWLAAVALFAVLVPALAGTPEVSLDRVLVPPGPGHPWGTDTLGRDVLVRSALALRGSLLIALAASLAAAAVGLVVGALAAVRGGWVDRVCMRAIDLVGGLPHTLLAGVIASFWPGEPLALVLVMAVTHWTLPARVIRAVLLEERESGPVLLARATGASPLQRWATHLLPAVSPHLVAAVVLQAPHALWLESTLSFLGLGLSADAPSLGLLLDDARAGLLSGAWWLLVAPAALLVTTALALGALAPRSRPGRRGLALAPLGTSRRHAVRDALQDQGWSARGLQVSYPGTGPVLDGVDLLLSPGTITVLAAPSGGGKTTLLRALSGMLPAGAVMTGDVGPVTGPRMAADALGAGRGRHSTLVPSGIGSLHPARRVGRQVAETLRVHGLPAGAEEVARRLAHCGLSPETARRYPQELSGGMARRVALSLGLATSARVLLLDEPTASLDGASAALVVTALRLRAADGAAVLVATHDSRLLQLPEARRWALSRGQLVAREPGLHAGLSTAETEVRA